MKFPRTLTGRLAVSYIALTVAINLLLLAILNYGLKSSLERGVDTFLAEISDYESDLSTEKFLTEVREDFEDDDSHSIGEDFYVRAFDSSGQTILSKGMAPSNTLRSVSDLVQSVEPGKRQIDTVALTGGRRLRVVTQKFLDGFAFQAGTFLIQDTGLERRVFSLGMAGVVVLAFLAASVGWVMARQSMKGVREVTVTANNILHGSLEARVPDRKAPVEVAQLANGFNAMLDRIQELIGDVQRVSADMVHDLRSPLTRIRAQAELALRDEDATLDSYKELASKMVEESTILEELIHTTLEIITLDAGTRRVNPERCDLRALACDVLEIFQDVAGGRGIRLKITGKKEAIITTDPSMFRRVLVNLIDNALNYSPDEAEVTVGLRSQDESVILTVTDSGPGIPDEEKALVFQRFYRSDTSRRTPGAGLGLSYVLAAVEANGGDVGLEDGPGGGTQVTVRWPAEG